MQLQRDASVDADMKLINERYSNKRLEHSNVAIIDVHVCNDKIDRHDSRFTQAALRAIAGKIVGKPFIELHDMETRQPRGTFFKADVKRDLGGSHVAGSAFMLRTPGNAEIIAQIEGGVMRGTSVSFAMEGATCSICAEDIRGCAHYPGDEYGAERCHYIMDAITDVYECSLVPLGSQSTEVQNVRRLETIGDHT